MIDASGYVGRFAPSPTGDLHFGSLVAALVSYCQAKSNNGLWLVRMEDVDETRVVDGADREILNTLLAFGMESDLPIVYQTHPDRQAAYQSALLHLQQQGLTYPCTCTRAMLKGHEVYPGTCRDISADTDQLHSIRVKVPDDEISFVDLIQGPQQQNLKKQCGDFNIKRKDGLFAYQLAVVVDDADQAVTEIVRGMDILDSTPRQIYLNQRLKFKQPGYAHFPVIINQDGNKLSKQNHAKAVSTENAFDTMKVALKLLGQRVPVLKTKSQKQLLKFAVENWNLKPLESNKTLYYSAGTP
jgi:glutamyl-Q tRNA(Asp) synthetase